MSEPTVRLLHAEMLYVAIGVITQELERKTDYPTDNLHLTLSAYEKGRDEFLRSRGWTESDRLEVTAAATEALTSWLDERTMKASADDFDAWNKEIFGE